MAEFMARHKKATWATAFLVAASCVAVRVYFWYFPEHADALAAYTTDICSVDSRGKSFIILTGSQ